MGDILGINIPFYVVDNKLVKEELEFITPDTINFVKCEVKLSKDWSQFDRIVGVFRTQDMVNGRPYGSPHDTFVTLTKRTEFLADVEIPSESITEEGIVWFGLIGYKADVVRGTTSWCPITVREGVDSLPNPPSPDVYQELIGFIAEKLSDSPFDGKTYARNNGEWVEVTGGSGGVSDYSDLSGKPQINGVTLNGNKSLEELGIQPAGGVVTETDPTVPAWAKQANKPAYTKAEVGLENVDNTSDANKPLSNATQTALGGKANISHKHDGTYQPAGNYLTAETDPTVSAWAKQPTKPSYTAGEVGAETAGTVSTHNSSETAHSDIRSTLASKADLVDGVVPANQLPSYVDDVLEYADLASLPATGTTGKIYITLDTNLTYRWSGSGYVEISKSLALGETSATAYRGDRGKTAYDHSQVTHAPIDAEKNVQSDWLVSDTNSDAFIANKPTALTPTAHKTTHATGGSDALTAIDIGAEPSGTVSTHNQAVDAHSDIRAALDGKQPAGSYLTSETDPTVPAWAKEPSKPSYTAAEIGAEESGAVSAHNSSGTAHADIRSALGAKADSASLATVATSGSYNDLSNQPTIPVIWSGTQATYDAITPKVATTIYLIIG